MGYDGLRDLDDNGRPAKQSDLHLKDAKDEFDESLACKRFPSIALGSSPQVELYDETACWSDMSNLLATQNCEGFVSNSIAAEWVQESSHEMWSSPSPTLPSVTTSTLREEASNEPSSCQPMALETIKKSDCSVTVEKSSIKVGPESPVNAASAGLSLDTSISCIPGLSKRHARQLENCGFNTVGLYADCL